MHFFVIYYTETEGNGLNGVHEADMYKVDNSYWTYIVQYVFN
jgi:hypothetical protein